LALVMSGANLRFPSEDANALESSLSFQPSQIGAGIAGLLEMKVLVIAMSSDIETMDPAKTSAMYGPPGMIYETLITRDLTGAFRPGLAEWWNLNTTDPDHPTFEIRLQQGVKFHDNTVFDSNAVKRIINYYSDNDSWVQYEFWAIYGCQNKTGWPNAGIWCKDAYNMVLNLTWADVALQFNLSHLYGSMMSPDALESDGLAVYGTPGHKVVGTGPFILKEWVPSDHVTLVKNENYTWGASWYTNKGPAKIDKVIYRIIADEASRSAGFESGAIDVLQQVPPNKVQTYAANSEMTVITGPGQGTYHVDFNCQKAPWTNVSLRKAFGYAINRTQILESVWHGYGQEGVNYLPPIEPEGRLIPAQYNFSYDLVKSATLFAQAGYENRDSDPWLEKSDMSELTLNLGTTNKGEDVSMSEMLKNQFEAMGVHVNLLQYEESTLRSVAAAGQHDSILFWYSWPRAEILDWEFGTWAMGGSNMAWFSDAIFDNFVTNWTFAETEQEFSDNATAGHIRLLTLAPRAPIMFWHQIHAIHNNVMGWYVHPLGLEQVFDIVDVDVTAPPVTTVTLGGTILANNWYVTSVTLNLSAIGDVSGVNETKYRLNGGAWHNYTGNVSLSNDGTMLVEYYSTDYGGFVETVKSVTVKIDKTDPTLTINQTSGFEATVDHAIISWIGSDATSGIDRFEVSIDGYAFTSVDMAMSHNFSGLADGTHNVTVKAIDAAGNEVNQTIQFTIDTSISGGGISGDLMLYGGIAAIIVVVVVIAIAIMMRKRKSS